MYNTFDKTNTFYYYNHHLNKHVLIGNKEQFISYLSQYFGDTEYFDTVRWSWSILNDQNVTMNDTYFVEDNYYLRKQTFYDGEYRIIDVRNYYVEAINYYQNHIYVRPNIIWGKKRKHRKYYSGNHMRNKMPRTSRIIRMNAPVEMKEFSRGTEKLLPKYWDDKGRRVSSCWKDQRKYKKQWMHKINSKNCDSIRFWKEED